MKEDVKSLLFPLICDCVDLFNLLTSVFRYSHCVAACMERPEGQNCTHRNILRISAS